MTENSVSEEARRLDEITEKAIEDFRARVRQSMNEGRTPFGRLETARGEEEKGLAALRKRIRTLIEEARKDATRGWILVGPASTIFPKHESSDD